MRLEEIKDSSGQVYNCVGHALHKNRRICEVVQHGLPRAGLTATKHFVDEDSPTEVSVCLRSLHV